MTKKRIVYLYGIGMTDEESDNILKKKWRSLFRPNKGDIKEFFGIQFEYTGNMWVNI
jgi:hypothetical protein